MVIANTSNTIDFDAAKLRRMGLSERRKASARPLTLNELRRLLNHQLQTSLELDRVLALFFASAPRLVPLDAMTYVHSASEFKLELGAGGIHTVAYELTHEQNYLGELVFRREHRFQQEELTQLEALLACLLFPLRNALLYRTAVQNGMRDSLTNTGNRYAMDQTLRREVDLALRHLHPLSILMVDIDHFKKVNDTYGHGTGDDVLRAVSATLTANLRNIDMVFRFGGEEFLVLMSSTDSDPATMVAERLCTAVQQLQFLVHGNDLQLSISVGCATLQSMESMDSLLRRADAALYMSKHGGRNRVTSAPSF
ncbi:GGDEF domain-containing protein [Pseudomonas matsuisoli]|uniref:diguanylate cyclase n=1 Tax=Pseudomonas matsuisoli TaxID=1515666 RepID=A0A917PHL6_9PSED|nr:GGDEF domain-containing protein [Pseudomonas matsuisoli]GGJ79242.1 GGDEF domain-containing protein [Pseudomonas matsuisoli]